MLFSTLKRKDKGGWKYVNKESVISVFLLLTVWTNEEKIWNHNREKNVIEFISAIFPDNFVIKKRNVDLDEL